VSEEDTLRVLTRISFTELCIRLDKVFTPPLSTIDERWNDILKVSGWTYEEFICESERREAEK